jgi:hypothetical protein
MADLVTRGTGQLEDLIDIDDGGPCPVRGKKMKARTRKFIKAIKREWDRRLAFGRRRALLAAFEVRRQWAVSRMAA